MTFTADQVLFLDVANVYGADELGLPFRDIMGEGAVGTNDFKAAQRAAGANMSVDVAAGACWVKGDDDADRQPTYRYREPAITNVAVNAADATNPRIDRVVAEVLDATFSGVSKLGRVRVIAGTPTSGATLVNLTGAAAVPNNALLLANVLVPAASSSVTTANIADKRTFAAVGGGAASGSIVAPTSVLRKTTAKAVTNTVTETDLLNGEFTVGAGSMGTDKVARLTLWGDWIQNSGGATKTPQFRLKLGAGPTVVLDTGAPGGAVAANSATRFGWRIVAEVMNLGATSSQLVNIILDLTYASAKVSSVGADAGEATFATGEGRWGNVPEIDSTGLVSGGRSHGEGFGTSAIDTTVAVAVALAVINPTATATCETKLRGAILEVV